MHTKYIFFHSSSISKNFISRLFSVITVWRVAATYTQVLSSFFVCHKFSKFCFSPSEARSYSPLHYQCLRFPHPAGEKLQVVPSTYESFLSDGFPHYTIQIIMSCLTRPLLENYTAPFGCTSISCSRINHLIHHSYPLLSLSFTFSSTHRAPPLFVPR